MAGLEPPDDEAGADDAALWAAVRRLSDGELQRIQSSIRQFHSTATAASAEASVQVELEGHKQHVRVDDLVHVFVDYLHRQTQLHAEAQVSGNDKGSVDTEDGSKKGFELHKEEFPQLGGSSNGNKTGEVKLTKRRITTTLVTTTNTTARPVPATIEFPALGATQSEKSSVWKRQSLLERRMATSTPVGNKGNAWTENGAPTGSSVVMQVATKKKSSNAVATWGAKPVETTAWGARHGLMMTEPTVMKITSRKKANANAPQVLLKKATRVDHQESNTQRHVNDKENNQDNHASAVSVPENQTEHEVGPTAADFQVNRQAAKLYGFLIKERFVTSTTTELQVLISLLYRSDCAKCSTSSGDSVKTISESEIKSRGGGGSSCEASSEFCWRIHCLEFAEIVLHEIEGVIVSLGSNLLGLVKESLRSTGEVCTAMLGRLEMVSQRREELRVAESARIGCQLPIEMNASAVRDFALPFCEETDSRLHYRTPAESSLYSNREKVRDGFLSLLRQFQQKQHSLIGIENADVSASAIASARGLLSDVSPENRWWFAKFFVLELVQVGSNPFGENDMDLVKLVEKNPDRLLKLHRRFSSQKPSNKSPQPHSGSAKISRNNNNSSKSTGKGNIGHPRRSQQSFSMDTKKDDVIKTFAETFGRMRGFFTDNQLFFFHFLHSCDSYEFSELVKHQLERQFYSILNEVSASNDARKEFTEVVLRLKVVAKFIGYLRFSPQWQVTSSIRRLSAQNAAFKAVEREGISTLEVARDSNLDVKKLLEDSILESTISKCIPWLCDYLGMLSYDTLSSGTTYFKQLMVLLQILYRSPRLNSLGETGLYVAMQIERTFQTLNLRPGLLSSSEYKSRELLPSPQVRLALASANETPQKDPTEDHLPFLYNQVFVQSCLSELDDLRSFIQTRAQPLNATRRHSIGSKAKTTDQATTPIRKLRPLQVVIEDDHTGIPIHPTAMGMISTELTPSLPHMQQQESGSDKLSEAVFKVHPKLKTVVEFVVGNVTTDVCEHVMEHVVTLRADHLVDQCASESGLISMGSTKNDSTTTAARASFSMLISSKTRPEVKSTIAAALQEALRLAEERICAGIPPLMPPSSHPTLTKAIVAVGLQRARAAIQTLVPKSVQRHFVKRLAFRNKSLLKDFNSTSKEAVGALPHEKAVRNEVANPFSSSFDSDDRNDSAAQEVKQRYRQLKECVAAMSNSIASNDQSVAAWKQSVAAISTSLAKFSTAFAKSAEAGDLDRDHASPLSIWGVGLWDILWRATVSCLKFHGHSLEALSGGSALATLGKKSIEQQLTNFVVNFTLMLEAFVLPIRHRCVESGTAAQLQSIVAFVMDYMVALPPGIGEVGGLVGQFAIQTSSHVVARLRAVLADPVGSKDNQQQLFEMNWDHWRPSSESKQFRIDVWNASERLLQ